ncbi:MAG TPA: UDP-3-O-(3-hydroxymyristoyl)glucosamine N-acyltransferase [Longimicrobiales bacterium]|nr:UDP-3-O-(3-hydroxymyristoyl)glucosamine N-acyltransferase [Longimicrobiales bacterium]
MSSGARMTLGRIAEWTGGRVDGDPEVRVRRPMPLETAGEGDLALLADEGYLARARGSAASAFLVSERLVKALDDSRPRVVVEDARAALLPLLERLDPTPRPEPGVHPTAVLGDGVELGEDVHVGPYAVLGARARIGSGTVVGAHCVVGAGARLGADCYLHPQVVLYPMVTLGDRVILQAGARIGSDGFGYVAGEGGYESIPQVGACVLEDGVEVGANTCIDRGSIGDTVIERGVKLDNLIHLAHNVRVGAHTAMAAFTGVAGSTRIGEWCRFGGQAGTIGHLSIGDRVDVAAQAGIIGDVPDGASVTGYPARPQNDQKRVWAAGRRVPDALKRLRALEREVEALRERLDRDDG